MRRVSPRSAELRQGRRTRLGDRARAILTWALTGWVLSLFADAASGETLEPRTAEPAPTAVLRCWQEGRLIFEQERLEVGSLETPGEVTLRARTIEGDAMTLLRVGQATCLVETSEQG